MVMVTSLNRAFMPRPTEAWVVYMVVIVSALLVMIVPATGSVSAP